MRSIRLGLFLLILSLGFSQQLMHAQKSADSLKGDPFLNTVEQSLKLFYADYTNDLRYDSIITALKYEQGEVPSFTDEQICERLGKMNEMTPFQLECNQATISTIRFFARERRSFIRIAMGRSALYFDMYREKLAEYGLPIELRFLSVIESGLRPQIKSKAGALGLWQFMYKTGLYFNLEENSYIDERMDPEKSTEAACRFLRQLYGIYGDWNLALAAYNAGPGNVNKAIRKSGNKSTYWEVRPYLPKETQGYVPNFIAAAYLMTYHAEHNIIPLEAEVHNAELDTMCLKQAVHMNTISKLTGWDLEEIKLLNPVYKTTYIPKSNIKRCISGPFNQITLLVGLEDSLYALEKSIYRPDPVNTPRQNENNVTRTIDSMLLVEQSNAESDSSQVSASNLQYYKVKPGDNLKLISLKFNVTIQQIMEWNALRTTNLYVGQRLKVLSETVVTQNQSIRPEQTTNPIPQRTPKVPKKKYYKVRPGDNFSDIAQKYNLTIAQLKKLNPKVKINRIQVGQQIRVK
ncbi:MAG: LysM peptidoglycan-binding domain-containing protein [Bacteroidetes bacterium]|nr:LysM peptidoglycan-binding domain-containing protein [Bacteroidota bacterium]